MANEPVISHHVGLNRTPALSIAVRGWLHLIETGHCSNYVQIEASQNAFLAEIDGEPAGVMTYKHDPVMKELVIGIGYILPAFRGLGLYRKLWAALVEQAQNQGVTHIASATFISNHAMRAVAANQGRVERTITLDYSVPASTDP